MSNHPDFHEDFARHEDVRGSSNRGFGMVFTIVFAVIGLVPLLGGGGVRWWSVALAGAILGAAFFAPRLLAPFNFLWMRFGLLLHRAINPLIMALLFFSTVTPIGLLMRALGKDPLRLKWDRAAASYWIARTPPGPAPDTMKNQF
ncbi:MAG: SxtJ family membrane protein [Alphaproteobacteria bacterium]